jgi:hypothetical protein
VETFKAYSGCVDQDHLVLEAGENCFGGYCGSMDLRLDDLPHTGATNYGDVLRNNESPAAIIVQTDRTFK